MLSSCVGLLEELRHEISVGDTTLAKVTVKVIMRGKQGAGKSSFVAACCGDAVLGDDYMKTVGLQVRTCLWPIKVGTRLRAPYAPIRHPCRTHMRAEWSFHPPYVARPWVSVCSRPALRCGTPTLTP